MRAETQGGAMPPGSERDYHDPEVARHYHEERWAESRRARRIDRREHRLVRDLLGNCGRIGSILDVPCGAGRFSAALLEVAPRVVGCDVSRHMVARAGESAAVQGSALALPFPDDTFDLVFCFRLLHHFPQGPERVAVMIELARVSRRWVLGTFFDRHSFLTWLNLRRKKKAASFTVSGAEFREEAAAAALLVRDRRWVSRHFSAQTLVLMELAESR